MSVSSYHARRCKKSSCQVKKYGFIQNKPYNNLCQFPYCDEIREKLGRKLSLEKVNKICNGIENSRKRKHPQNEGFLLFSENRTWLLPEMPSKKTDNGSPSFSDCFGQMDWMLFVEIENPITEFETLITAALNFLLRVNCTNQILVVLFQ